MKKNFAVFLAGIGISVLAGLGIRAVYNGRVAQRTRELRRHGREKGHVLFRSGQDVFRRDEPSVEAISVSVIDLNDCSSQQLVAIGVDDLTARRIVELRPYRSKLELVSRLMLPADLYSSIKDRISVSGTDEGVKIAS
ncbi:MAG TPA: hypothetical protein VD837_19880 [Terriglobales bacterium]|nr:hypothetical protein [Terriglobales bacterium]